MKNNKFQTHVIGGKYRGLKLDLPSLVTTRSSKSILKESLFNTLNVDIIDELFIEMFAGSGSVMIEALSRGALHAYGLECDKNAYKVLVSNCKKIEQNTYTCKNADSFLALSDIVNSLSKSAYLYVDPPFEYRQDMQNIYQKCFNLIQTLDINKIKQVIFEHMSIEKMPQNIGKLQLIKSKKFGKSSLSYYAK